VVGIALMILPGVAFMVLQYLWPSGPGTPATAAQVDFNVRLIKRMGAAMALGYTLQLVSVIMGFWTWLRGPRAKRRAVLDAISAQTADASDAGLK
jgi:hypothetical protein